MRIRLAGARREPGNGTAGARERHGGSPGTARREPGNGTAGARERHGGSSGTDADEDRGGGQGQQAGEDEQATVTARVRHHEPGDGRADHLGDRGRDVDDAQVAARARRAGRTTWTAPG